MHHFISPKNIQTYVSSCINSGLFNTIDDTSAVFYDFNHLFYKTELLRKAFPENTFHTTAIKANPLIKVLHEIKKIGFGSEAASEGELFLAQKAGFDNYKIVFDSPAKTHGELEYALKNDFHINADSIMELDRIARIKESVKSESTIGLRINPQVGYGKIKSTSLAGEYSKFGVPLKSHKQEILDCFKKYKWLTGIHLHIGSQGCEMDLLLNGIESGLKLIKEINELLIIQNREASFIDIGGGLPVSYHHNMSPPDIIEYGEKISEMLTCYNLNKLQIITEFGRYLHANSGFIISKVEYVKHYEESNTLIIHSGADILLRECLNPDNWYHEFSLLDKTGKLKQTGKTRNYLIAGPLCLASDIVARNVELPVASEGDYIVIHDTGGYTFGMWSKYVSRLFPKIIGINNNSYEVIRKREKLTDILDYWSV